VSLERYRGCVPLTPWPVNERTSTRMLVEVIVCDPAGRHAYACSACAPAGPADTEAATIVARVARTVSIVLFML